MRYKHTKLLLIPAIFAMSACSMMPTAMKHDEQNDVILPKAIEITDVNNAAMLTTDVIDYETFEVKYPYFYTVRKTDASYPFYLKAVIVPNNCSYPEIKVTKDEQKESFDIFTQKDDPSLGDNIFVIKPNYDLKSNERLMVSFYFISTDPDESIKTHVCVDFYRNT